MRQPILEEFEQALFLRRIVQLHEIGAQVLQFVDKALMFAAMMGQVLIADRAQDSFLAAEMILGVTQQSGQRLLDDAIDVAAVQGFRRYG